MADDTPISGGGINVGDAILTFLGDTTGLERAWTAMEQTSSESADRTVSNILSAYDRIGVEGSLKLKESADKAAASFEDLKNSGVASITDLIQSEQQLLEKQAELKMSLGEAIPIEVTERIESLRLQYIGLTGSVEEFAAAQEKSAAVVAAASATADRNSVSLKRQAEATLAESAALEAQWAEQNKVSSNNYKRQGSGGGAGGGASAEEEGALAGGAAALGSTAKTLALYAGIAAVAGSLAEGVKQSLAFDAAFAELSSVLQTGGKEDAATIAAIKQQLLDLPPVLGDITTLTKGTYQAISAGIPAGEAVRFVADAAVYARAALTDQETAVKLVSASLNAYGLTAQDATHVTSALFETIKVGVLRGPELAESLGRVLPVAANLKVSFAEVLAAASTLTRGGLSADESMTALRQTLSAIEKPSSEATKAMRETGLSFADVRAEIREKGLAAALADLATHIQGNTQLTTELFPNIRALTGVLSLTGGQAKFYASAVQDINKAYADGTQAQTAFQTITSSLDGRLKTLGSTISNDFVGGFQKLMPIIESFGPSLKGIIVDTGALHAVVIGLVAVLTGLAIVLSSTAVLTESLRSGVYGLGVAFTSLQLFTHAYTGSAEQMRARIQGLKDTMKEADDAAHANAASIKTTMQAYSDFVQGSNKAAEANRANAGALTESANAQDAATISAKKVGDALEDQSRKAAEAKEAHDALEKQVQKTTKAMEQYAKASNIPLAEELNKNVAAAQKFAEAMARTNQPIATQNAAVINLMTQLRKLHDVMEDQSSFGQSLFNKGQKSGPVAEGPSASEQMAKDAEKNAPLIQSPLVNAWNAVLEAENKLGVQGPVTLAKLAAEAQEAATTVRESWLHGVAGVQDVIAADAALEAANAKLAASFKSGLQIAVENALDAENALGIKGTQSLIENAARADKAFQQLKDSGVENTHQLMEAELVAAKADRDLKLQLGQPVGAQAEQSIAKMTLALKAYQQQMQSTKKEDQDWYNFWHQSAPTMTQDLNKLGDMGTEAFKSLSSNFGSAIQEFESGQKSLGAAVEEAVSKTLESLSGQAAAYALFYTGLGLAALAEGDAASAGNFFLAAAEMAAVAVVAGSIGMAMGGGSSATTGGGSGPSQSTTGATQGPVNPVNTQNVSRFGGGGLVTGRTLAMIGDSKSNANQNATEAILPLDDEESMNKLRTGLGTQGGGGMTMIVQGLISPDNLGQVMDQMSARVQAGKKLVASHANRVIKKS